MHATAAEPLWHFENFDAMREARPVYSGSASGHRFHTVTRMEQTRSVLQDVARFSTAAVAPHEPCPPYLLVPVMLDPPQHTQWRRLLGPWFSPAAVEARTSAIEKRFMEVLAPHVAAGGCEFVADVALPFSYVVLMDVLGLDRRKAAAFTESGADILVTGTHDRTAKLRGLATAAAMFGDVVVDRRREPRDDLVTAALGWQIDDRPVGDHELVALCMTIFLGGLETVAAQLSYSVFHLANNLDDQRSLRNDPEKVDAAIEELLCFYSPVAPGRQARSDLTLDGVAVRAGEVVYLPLAAANRDPRGCPRADVVDLERHPQTHIAFGAGIHRCRGSHLAKRQLQVALQMLARQVGEYRPVPGEVVTEHGGEFGLDRLCLAWQAKSEGVLT